MIKTNSSTINKVLKREEAKDPNQRYSFFENVYEVVRLIPVGRVTSFGAIANYLGSKLSARMVGWAMNGAHHVKPYVPAHRVLNRNGVLTGRLHFETDSSMEEQLKKENIRVIDNTVVNFKEIFWDPALHLEII